MNSDKKLLNNNSKIIIEYPNDSHGYNSQTYDNLDTNIFHTIEQFIKTYFTQHTKKIDHIRVSINDGNSQKKYKWDINYGNSNYTKDKTTTKIGLTIFTFEGQLDNNTSNLFDYDELSEQDKISIRNYGFKNINIGILSSLDNSSSNIKYFIKIPQDEPVYFNPRSMPPGDIAYVFDSTLDQKTIDKYLLNIRHSLNSKIIKDRLNEYSTHLSYKGLVYPSINELEQNSESFLSLLR